MPHLLPLFSALVLASAAEALEASGAFPWYLGLVWLFVPRVIGRLAVRTASLGEFRRAAVLGRVLAISGTLGFAFWLFATDWRAALTAWTGDAPSTLDWPTLASLLVFVPFVALELAVIDATARLAGPGYRRARRFQWRQFLATLTPFALFATLGAAVGVIPTMRVRLEEVALLQTAFTAALFALLILGLPRLLTLVWETVPLPATLARAFEELLRRSERRVAGAHLWLTGGTVANAAVVGFTPGTRRVFVSDVILSMLTPRELLAVLAHELGHVRRGHAVTFGQFALTAFVALQLAAEPLAAWSLGWQLVFLAAGVALFFAAFGYLSRRFELEADLESRALTGDPEALKSALQQVSPHRMLERHSWRHFAPAHRTRFLARAEQDASVVPRFTRGLDHVRRAARVLAVLALTALLWTQIESWSDDQAVADLTLGRYESALDRDVDDEGVAQLLALLRALPPAARNLDTFAEAAREAPTPEAARGWLELLALRGDEGALAALADLATE